MKFELNEIEIENFHKFKKTHGIGICDAFKDSTGACFTFCFTPTVLGTATSVECGCGEQVGWDKYRKKS